MSWDAFLVCDCCGNAIAEWNYTHNTNGMANLALDGSYEQMPVFQEVFSSDHTSWRVHLDGMTGADGAEFLGRIIEAFNADPEKYRALNPSNGWGDFDSFRDVLVAMRDSVPDTPCTWAVLG